MDSFNGFLRLDIEKFRSSHAGLLMDVANKQMLLNEGVGFKVNVNSPKDLQKLFVDKCGCPVLKFNIHKKRPSFAKEVLDKLDTPFTKQVQELKHLLGVEKYFRIAENYTDREKGGVPFELQLESVTGRIYAKEPSVMSFPAEIRECVIPDKDGEIFIGGDIANEELTILAYLVGCDKFIKDVKDGMDIFMDMGVKFGVSRGDIKTSTYAYMYGADPQFTSSKLFDNPDTVQKILDKLFVEYPEFKKWKEVTDKVRAMGYSQTLIEGRRYEIRKDYPDQDEELRRAVNFIIQGTASDVLRAILKELEAAGVKIKVFVHDSVVIAVSKDKEVWGVSLLGEVMSRQLGGIFRTKVKSGKTWREVWE